MKIVNPTFKENGLSEINQTVVLKFSWATIEDNKIFRLHEWVKCRDFLGDVLWANRYNESEHTNIYNFYPKRFEWKEQPSLLLKFPNVKIMNTFFENIHSFLNKMSHTETMQFTEVSSLVFIATFDKWWMQTIPQLSFLTFLFKVACYKYENVDNWIDELKQNNPSCVEAGYIKPFLPTLVANFDKVFETTPSLTGWEAEGGLPIYTIHNSCGFYSLFSGNLTSNFYSRKFSEVAK